MRDNSPPYIYAIMHGAVSCKGYFALALVVYVFILISDF